MGVLEEKFGFVDNVKSTVNDMVSVITNTSSAPTFSINVSSDYYTGSVNILDLSWYAPYKEYGDTIICIFAYLSYLWHIFMRLPDIISGAGAASYSGNMVQDIRSYNATGFGRAANIRRR